MDDLIEYGVVTGYVCRYISYVSLRRLYLCIQTGDGSLQSLHACSGMLAHPDNLSYTITYVVRLARSGECMYKLRVT